jgi:hypothetical protein
MYIGQSEKQRRKKMIAIFIAPFYIALNIYLFWRIKGWVQAYFPKLKGKKGWIVPIVLYAFLASALVIAFFLPQGRFRRGMKLVGNYWLGVLLYMIFFIVIAELGRFLLLHVFRVSKDKICVPRVRRIVGCACATLIICISIWGVVNARLVRVTPYDVTINKEVQDENGQKMDSMKIVLVADLHLGYNIGTRQVQRIVNSINKQDADLVLIAGDIFDNEWEAVDQPEELEEILRGIKSKYGVYACYGNHDIQEQVLAGFTFGGQKEKTSSPEMDEFMEKAGITLLRDEGVLINDSIYIYGRRDAHRPGNGVTDRVSADEITKNVDKSKAIIVLDHEPKELEELSSAGVDMDLCGHTHDGQMFPGNILVAMMWENSCGYLNVDGMHNIVTSGVGVFGPDMRVGTKAEICPITVNFK